MKKYIIDTHVHTISSGHAYSTLSDYVEQAKSIGLEMFAITDHGPEMPGASHWYQIANQRVIPDYIEGIRVLKGAEVNIMDFNGKLDIHDSLLEKLDLVIASLHPPCIKPGTIEENTNALIGAMKNPNVDIIGHSGNPEFEIDIEAFVKAAKEYNCAIEINNSSDNTSRIGSNDNCMAIAEAAKTYGVYIATGSDAHYKSYLGDFSEVDKIIQEIGIKKEQILNTSTDRLLNYLESKGK